jgi:hypothetical protein
VAVLTAGLLASLPVTSFAKPSPRPTAAPTPTPTATPAPPSHWSIVSSPSPPSASLSAAAGVSANDVWAVGDSLGDPIALHWNGSQWDIVPTPKPAGDDTQAQLRGVTAVSGNDVWAVGYSANPSAPAGGYETLAEHWDGRSWSIVPTPNPSVVGPYGISLNAVAAISGDDIWAVGGNPYNASYDGPALLEHWDGSRWSIVEAPAEIINWHASTRTGLAAAASNDVWAVGVFDSFHWNGTAWSVVRGAQNTSSAAAAGAASVWAAGYDAPSCYSCSGSTPVAYRWNGASWIDTLPVSPTYEDTFRGVSARAVDDVWAVGTRATTSTLTEHWDGTSWRVEPSPNASSAPYAVNFLTAVVAIARDDAWAVGWFTDGSGGHFTLTMHYAEQ